MTYFFSIVKLYIVYIIFDGNLPVNEGSIFHLFLIDNMEPRIY